MPEKFRILIVDDDDLVLELMKHVARRNPDLAVEPTTDPARAIEWIRSREQPFHIVVSDLVMPQYSGIDVLRAARIRSPDTLGIIVTGFGDQQSTAEAIKLGITYYLRKPFRREELELALTNATTHFHLRRTYEQAKTHHARRLAESGEQARHLADLQRQARELGERLAEYREQEEDTSRFTKALAKARQKGEGRSAPVLNQLNDLGRLYQQRQISAEEFHVMRKSLLDKAYKSIL